MSEQTQLEAAIRASLDDIDNGPLVISSENSDTEHVSLSSDDDTDNPAKLQETTPRIVKSLGQSSQADSKMEAKHSVILPSHAINRKRVSAVNDNDDVGCVKRARTDLEPMCNAINNIELENSLPKDSPDSDVRVNTHDRSMKSSSSRRGKARTGSGGNGSASTSDPLMNNSSAIVTEETPEEQLTSGRIHKDDVSHILFRLPDGSRLHKSFLSTDLIRVSSFRIQVHH